MKHMLCLLLAALLCAFAFSGCAELHIKETYGYVVYVMEDGFVADTNDVGCVLVTYANAQQIIGLFDTVRIEYDTNELKETSGTYIGLAGGQESYAYTLERVKNVRPSDPSKGEPLFG